MSSTTAPRKTGEPASSRTEASTRRKWCFEFQWETPREVVRSGPQSAADHCDRATVAHQQRKRLGVSVPETGCRLTTRLGCGKRVEKTLKCFV